MSTWRDELITRLRDLRLRPEREAEIVEELSQHLDDRVRELEAGGASPEAARREALADLDAPGALARQLAAIEARSPLDLPPPGTPARGRWLAALAQDLRHAVAGLRRTPGFAFTVVTALALTIGPTTGILSVANWLIWRPPPGVVQPDRLAVVWFGEWGDDGSVRPRRVSEPNIVDLEAGSTAVAAIGGWQESRVSVAADGVVPRLVGSAHATVDLFDLLGVHPAVGRGFTPDDDQPPMGSPVAILGDALARGLFGGAEAAIGRTLDVNGQRLSVIGVLPPGFVGLSPFSQVGIWFPSSTYYHVNHFSETTMRERAGRARGGVFYTFVVRLAPGSTFERLQGELDALVPALAARYPDDNEAFRTTRARVFPGLGTAELQRDRYRSLVDRLLLVGLVLLLLGCANVANLLMSRSGRRQHDRAVRAALGASRARLVQLLLIESCLLALAGAALGVVAAVWLRDLIQALLLPGVYTLGTVPAAPIDGAVLATTLGLSVCTGLVAGLAPAWTGSDTRPSAALGAGSVRTSRAGVRLRAGFAVLQFALSLALVTNALLLVGTLRQLAGVDVGFDARGVTTHALDLGSQGYDAERALTYDRELLARLAAAPGFQAASLSYSYPFSIGWINEVRERPGEADATFSVDTNFVTPAYFDVLRIPLLQGRTFTAAEALSPAGDEDGPAIVDERLARRLFGEAPAIGRSIQVAGRPDRSLTVIGVARNARWGDLTDEPDPVLYLPFTDRGGYAAVRPVVLVRSGLSARAAGELVQAQGSAIDPSLPFGPPRPLSAAVERVTADRRAFATVLTLLGALGFVLAAVGLYGLLSQLVVERTREFGIRLAIGARRGHVFGLVLRQAGWIAVLGGVAGLGLAALGSRFVESQLFGVSRLDPAIYLTAALALTLVVFAASAWPARSATRIEPVEALHRE
ncbi:MAG: ADOP family duplicated permease [Vicinamibacterales bacterium]